VGGRACRGEAFERAVGQVETAVLGAVDRGEERCGFGQRVGVAEDDHVAACFLGGAYALVAAACEAESFVVSVDVHVVGVWENRLQVGLDDGVVAFTIRLPRPPRHSTGDTNRSSGR